VAVGALGGAGVAVGGATVGDAGRAAVTGGSVATGAGGAAGWQAARLMLSSSASQGNSDWGRFERG